MRRRSCAAVLARPDYYVFGGARSADDVASLLDSADRPLRPWTHHLSDPPSRERGVT
ncbi:hypothetical protein [Streptomyces sp. NPDC005827]|uniref:hypothetical protein n=1 Tax=Streptomyces sp. NPDC005827 TaxID=3157070 RepID=UPI0034010C80